MGGHHVKDMLMATRGTLSSGVAQLVVDENSKHKTNINNMTLLKMNHLKNKGMKKRLIFSGVI